MGEFADLLNKIADLMKKVQDMSGGRKRGQFVFWTIFIICILLALKPSYDSAVYVITQISSVIPEIIVKNPIVNFIISVLLLLVGFAIIAGLIMLVGAFIGAILNVALDTAFRIRLDDTFIALIDLLRKANVEKSSSNEVKVLMDDTERLYERWKKVKANIFLGWIIPNIFKKDTTKWKIVLK